ncbi:F-box-like protein [Cinnamomum micranthum f. kanehirae]|uniref:F-box-like protein n=1 Tax=Cinnamomum micranthum f. kanehirae TaxID=337451 RepID=A0A3S3QP56_9MAGN|nr:F-box-like protein [Cinnamomum micranthum f. kanehirae]
MEGSGFLKKHCLKDTSTNSFDSCDYLSVLPDPLLLHILSFLPMKDVIKSSFLSRRWRSLWMYVPTIDFTSWWEPEVSKSVDRFLAYYKSKKIQKFCVSCSSKDVVTIDSWIHFTSRRDVEELYLDFSPRNDKDSSNEEVYGNEYDGRSDEDGSNEEVYGNGYHGLYKLPFSFFRSASLRVLTLKCCALNLPSSVSFTLLKTLCLYALEITGNMFKILTSGCPLLEDLTLRNCNSETDLDIFVANPHLKRLEINEYKISGRIEIYAPSLLMIEFTRRMERNDYSSVKKLPLLVSAKFDCNEMDDDIWEDEISTFSKWAELLGYLHVKDLKLCSWFIQALSINEVQDFTGPPIVATHLELTTGLGKWELPGLAYLLRNSSNLETLTLNVEESIQIDLQGTFGDDYDFDEQNYWKVESIPLQHLKMIRVNNFMGGYSHFRILSEEKILSDANKQLKFMKFLLRNSMILERMIIKISRETKIRELVDEAALLFKVTKKLLAFPRASPIAKVLISY